VSIRTWVVYQWRKWQYLRGTRHSGAYPDCPRCKAADRYLAATRAHVAAEGGCAMSNREQIAYWLLALASWALPADHPAIVDIHNAAAEVQK
jgi:hypothetical protein